MREQILKTFRETGIRLFAAPERTELMESFKKGEVGIDDAVQEFLEGMLTVIGDNYIIANNELTNNTDYDDVRLSQLLNKCGDYRQQLIVAMQFLANKKLLEELQDSLEATIGHKVAKEDRPNDPDFMAALREWMTETVEVNRDDLALNVAIKFQSAINRFKGNGLSCEESHWEGPIKKYIVRLEPR